MSLPIQLLYALFSSYPLFTSSLSICLSFSLSVSLAFAHFRPPSLPLTASSSPLPDSPCSAGGVITPLARSLVLAPNIIAEILSYLSCTCIMRTEKKADTDSPRADPFSPSFLSRVYCVELDCSTRMRIGDARHRRENRGGPLNDLRITPRYYAPSRVNPRIYVEVELSNV